MKKQLEIKKLPQQIKRPVAYGVQGWALVSWVGWFIVGTCPKTCAVLLSVLTGHLQMGKT